MSTPKCLEIVIADKNALVLSGLVELFRQDNRFDVRATAVDGELFLRLMERVRFDVGIIGWNMPHLDGRQVLTEMRERKSHIRMVVYSGAWVAEQVKALGGAAFYAKDEPPEGLLEVVFQVGQGKSVFPFVNRENPPLSSIEELTPRELEMLKMLAKGLTNRQIARQVDISTNTVKFHLKNLYEKIQVNNRAHAVSLYNEAIREA